MYTFFFLLFLNVPFLILSLIFLSFFPGLFLSFFSYFSTFFFYYISKSFFFLSYSFLFFPFPLLSSLLFLLIFPSPFSLLSFPFLSFHSLSSRFFSHLPTPSSLLSYSFHIFPSLLFLLLSFPFHISPRFPSPSFLIATLPRSQGQVVSVFLPVLAA